MGYYYQQKAIEESIDTPTGSQWEATLLEKSTDYYLRAASMYPDDEPQKTTALWVAMENLSHLGRVTIGRLRQLIQFAIKCEKADTYFRISHPIRNSIIAIIDRIEKTSVGDVTDLVLKPIRGV